MLVLKIGPADPKGQPDKYNGIEGMDETTGGHEKNNHRRHKEKGYDQKDKSNQESDLGTDPSKCDEYSDIDAKLLEDLKEISGNRFAADGRWFQISAGSGLEGFKGILDNDQPHHPIDQGAEDTGTRQER